MWALESLAWCGDHMSAAAHALARLADIDPEPDARPIPGPRQPRGPLRPVQPADLAPARSPSRCPRLAAPSASRRGVVGHAGHPSRAPRRVRFPITPSAVALVGIGPAPEDHLRGAVRRDHQGADARHRGRGEGFRSLGEVRRWGVRPLDHVGSLPVADRDRLLGELEALDPDSLGDEGRVEVGGRSPTLPGSTDSSPTPRGPCRAMPSPSRVRGRSLRARVTHRSARRPI